MANKFTPDDARAALAATRNLATDGLATPFRQADLSSILAVGIEVKSVDDGLLNFPTTIDGTDAYWCWRDRASTAA
ncbi:MAG TPA: DUF2203 family protein [Dehalococcoidia bacterium]|nr:DUF2203 family protein [Dehalococcoidia bacterium]